MMAAGRWGAMVVHPVGLEMPEDLVVGADALHRVLVSWLEDFGHRRDLASDLDRD